MNETDQYGNEANEQGILGHGNLTSLAPTDKAYVAILILHMQEPVSGVCC
jgi:hypothetical protein